MKTVHLLTYQVNSFIKNVNEYLETINVEQVEFIDITDNGCSIQVTDKNEKLVEHIQSWAFGWNMHVKTTYMKTIPEFGFTIYSVKKEL